MVVQGEVKRYFGPFLILSVNELLTCCHNRKGPKQTEASEFPSVGERKDEYTLRKVDLSINRYKICYKNE